VSLSVASINDESRLPTSVLFAVPTDGYNVEVSTHATPNGLGFRSRQKQVTSPKCPDRPWGPSSGYRALLAQEQSDQEVKLTTHVYLVPRLMSGGYLHSPIRPHGIQRENFYLTSPIRMGRCQGSVGVCFRASSTHCSWLFLPWAPLRVCWNLRIPS